MSETDTSTARNGGVKTIAFRFKPDLHAQITLVAQLRGHSLQDEVITAIESHLISAQADPDLQERVAEAQDAIDQEAQQRRATIAMLFQPQPAATEANPSAQKATANNRSGGRNPRS